MPQTHLTKRPCNPPSEPAEDLNDPDLRLSIDLFLGITNASQETYNSVRNAILRHSPDINILSFNQVKCRIAQLTGIDPLIHDICINTCMAYTGPFLDLEICPYCSEPRYDPITFASTQRKVTCQKFYMLPIGPQIQALWSSPESAENMMHRE